MLILILSNEMVQHRAVRFILCDLKGRASISAAIDTLELDNLSERRKKSRHDLLTILSNEECHEALSYSYDELMNIRPPDMAVTRAVSRGEPQKQFMQNRQPITTASYPVQYEKLRQITK